MSTLKVGTIQDHANSNTAISIDSGGRVTLNQQPMFQLGGVTQTISTDGVITMKYFLLVEQLVTQTLFF